MTSDALDEPRRKAARLAGVALLFAMALVIVSNYAISFRLIVPGNAAETARNILAHELLFRLNIACNLVYAATTLALLVALYVILSPVNRGLALVAALCRLIVALMWCATSLDTLGALRLLKDTALQPLFQAEQLQALSRLHLAAGYDAYYIGLPFWALSAALCGCLWITSRYIPRGLAVFGLLASSWGVFCAFAFLVVPHFDKMVGASWYDLPLALFEITLGFWLLFRGLRHSEAA